MEGPEKHTGKDYFFSADALTPQQVAESLTAATGRKFTAAVLDAETFLNETTQPGSMFEPAYSKGGFEFFRYVEDGRMAYVGTVRDDTKKILGREPLLLREWAKVHANELLEFAGLLNYFHLSCRAAEGLQLSRKWHATDISIACSARDAFSGEIAALCASLGNRMRLQVARCCLPGA